MSRVFSRFSYQVNKKNKLELPTWCSNAQISNKCTSVQLIHLLLPYICLPYLAFASSLTAQRPREGKARYLSDICKSASDTSSFPSSFESQSIQTQTQTQTHPIDHSLFFFFCFILGVQLKQHHYPILAERGTRTPKQLPHPSPRFLKPTGIH